MCLVTMRTWENMNGKNIPMKYSKIPENGKESRKKKWENRIGVRKAKKEIKLPQSFFCWIFRKTERKKW